MTVIYNIVWVLYVDVRDFIVWVLYAEVIDDIVWMPYVVFYRHLL